MASGRAQAEFQPMPLPQLRLSVQDQCRLRDRSTIMARQMYAGQGSQYADAQVRTSHQHIALLHGAVTVAWCKSANPCQRGTLPHAQVCEQ